MIIECNFCNTEWDTTYLRSRAAFDTEHPAPESWEGEMDTKWREHFKNAGYEFGATVGVLHRCPNCSVNKVEEDDMSLGAPDSKANMRLPHSTTLKSL